jgi:hypothetical protein
LKKILGILLIFVVILNTFFITSHAEDGEKIRFDEYGNLKFTTVGIKATTGTRYSTIGWQMFDQDKTSHSRKKSVVLKLDPDDKSSNKSENIGGSPKRIRTTFYISYKMITKRLKEEEENNPGWANQLLIDGGKVYLDPVYTIKLVKGNDENYLGHLNKRGEKANAKDEVYYSCEGEETLINGKFKPAKWHGGIKYARGWLHPDDFKDDYNKQLEFPSFISNVIIRHMTKDIRGNDVMMPNEKEKKDSLEHGMSQTYSKKVFPGYKYHSCTIQKDNGTIETKTDEFITITGKNKYQAKKFNQIEEGSFKEANVIFYYVPVQVTGTHQLKAEPDSQQVEGEKIEQMANITINLTQGAKSLENWKVFVGNSPVQLTVNLKRDKSGAIIQPQANYTYNISARQLLNYLSGEKLYYTDDLTQYPIAGGETIEFEYDADISVKVHDKTIPLSGSADVASFYRKPETDGYVSSPSYWSEIKQGDVYHEQFEAMAGTPTTRNLYYASGGSEFIVDIEVEYVPNGTATRRYLSKYNEVWCENRDNHIGPLHNCNLPRKTGGWSKSNPGPPTPRTITGYDGTVHAENTSVKSKKVVTRKATKTQSEKSHTEYQQVWSGLSSHTGCGPCCNHRVGGYSDTWSQNITFDYMKIKKVNVWEIKQSKVDGMREIIGTDEVIATIKKGNPNIFWNIASNDTSRNHRLRYSLETDQHDFVTWTEGDSDNKCSNSKDSGPVNEQKQFNYRRNLPNNAIAISDFLILQTSSGDQSVIYFQSDPSPTMKTTDLLEVPKTSKEEMWDNNPLSASKWSEDHINIGSYNGKYYRPNEKYKGSGNRTRVSTIFDSNPFGKNRPSRPSTELRLINTSLDIMDEIPNGEYITGHSSIFYELRLSRGSGSTAYSKSRNSKYGMNGQEFKTTYSDNHTKVNDIVIHNPVSAENAIVIPLPKARDQRTPSTKNIGGNCQEDLEEVEWVLDCKYTGGHEHTPSCYTTTRVINPNYVQPQEATTYTYNYIGRQQTFTAPCDGIYKLETWGAAGGTSYSDDRGYGGKGGYSYGEKYLRKGDMLYLYVGGKGSDGYPRDGYAYGGYNGGGSGSQYGRSDECGSGGGGATDIRTSTSLFSRIIVAGGGGGAGEDSEEGGHGGGMSGTFGGSNNSPGTQTSGYQLGRGENCSSSDSGGGGGGGYYGGRTDTEQAGAGGSGYIGGVSNGTTSSGINSGYGKIKITTPKIISSEPQYITVKTLNCTEPHHEGGHYPECYKEISDTISANKPVIIYDEGSGQNENVSPGNFINLDYPFQIYFPSTGDFYGNGQLGIGKTTKTRGKGFVNDMDTSEWIAKKSVTFGFNVIYNGKMYEKWEEISLPVGGSKYNFYCPLANNEEISSLVTFKVIANNGDIDNNKYPTNKVRYYNKGALHSALRKYNIDVVGRIGNLVIEDTQDFRYSNLFKEPLSSWYTDADWYVNQVIKKVDIMKQNNVVGSYMDIRGDKADDSNHFLNTYGLLEHLNKPSEYLWRQHNKPNTSWKPIYFPLSPSDNNIELLKDKPLTIGYKLLADVQTIGNYYTDVQIMPYYYYLDMTKNPSDPDYITPLDIYINVSGAYKPFNIFDAARSGADTSMLYPYKYVYNWDEEKIRRNYSQEEGELTRRVAAKYGYTDSNGNTKPLVTPSAISNQLGNGQVIFLKGRNRTFIGTDQTKGMDKNPGRKVSSLFYGLQAQRWHFTLGLPSSAVAVKHGDMLKNENIRKLHSKDGLILMAANIESVGNVYTLQYAHTNNPIKIGKVGTSNYREYPIPSSDIPYSVISVYSAWKSSRDDLTISGTH